MKGKQNSILKYVTTMFAVLFMATIFSTIKVQAEPIPEKISLKNLTVTAGNKFELRATLSPINADDDQLIWNIVKGKKVISFAEDDDRYGDDEVEFRAKKLGTATITCKNTRTQKKVKFKITVINDVDDDEDDDWD